MLDNCPRMASTSLKLPSTAGRRAQHEKDGVSANASANGLTEKLRSPPVDGSTDHETGEPYAMEDSDLFKPRYDHTHRKLKSRHIQLIGIGGCVDVLHRQISIPD
jgi:amino acid permease